MNDECSCRRFGAPITDPNDCECGGGVGGLKATLECVIAAYEEELAIVRSERDLAESVARRAIGDANHWKTNHADQVARCALLRQRPDLPVERLPAYQELVRLQEALRDTRDGLGTALDRIHDMLRDDDGQAWKEAKKALPRLEALARRSPYWRS